MDNKKFTLNLGNFPGLTRTDIQNISTALFKINHEYAFVRCSDESIYIDFDMDADVLANAIVRAISSVESVQDYHLRVISVEGDLVSLGEAAEIANVKKSTLSKYKKGYFGGGNFPAPIRKTGKKDPLWRLLDIVEWLKSKGKVSKEAVIRAKTITIINHALDARRLDSDKDYQKIANMLIE